MTKEMAEAIGHRISWYKDSADNCQFMWGLSMRLKVELDINKPLKRFLQLRTARGEGSVVSFTYERLPNFCCLCGLLGHIDRNCSRRHEEGFMEFGGELQYGEWLRAPVYKGILSAGGGSSSSWTGATGQRHTDSSAAEGEHSHRRGCSIFDPSTVIPAREHQMREVDNVILSKKLNLQRSGDYEDGVQGGGVHKDSPYGHNNNAQSVQEMGFVRRYSPEKPITATRKRKLPTSLSSHQSKRQNIVEISRRLRCNPAGSHDCISLELLRGREPLDSSKTWRVSPMYIPSFVFLSDTKSRKNRVDFIQNKFDLYGVEVPAQGRWGGLMMLWSKEMTVQLRSLSKEHIDVEIRGDSGRFGDRYVEDDWLLWKSSSGASTTVLREINSVSSLTRYAMAMYRRFQRDTLRK
ncbi:UNVERIFIED_CONTAM: hypothetical protein Scaly_1167400 [Sesamum calycinum]|uniref:Zinc knuckle CX2CX4HX4C domain-containing protein n=1 Tax=Sesamum calycinum TaxID=2727403 RepID=A0AAW2Q2X2_9LAMI